MQKSLPLAALLVAVSWAGMVSHANAALIDATLISVGQNSNRYGYLAWSRPSDTSTWSLDVVDGTAVQTGGTFSVQDWIAWGYTMTGATLGNFAPTATSWACIEGTLGATILAHICGQYGFGANGINDSVYTPTATGATVTLSGDDVYVGPPRTLENTLGLMSLTVVDGAPAGFQNYCLSSAVGTHTGPYPEYAPESPVNYCHQPGGNSAYSTPGYSFLFQTVVPAPPAIWLLGTALTSLCGRRWLRSREKVAEVPA
ncbi:MAG: hypothetical protein OEW88_10910 [Gammaproteobacteria bacterium]|nr:hypothetical protein [Gammaproteobacteria bacterium]